MTASLIVALLSALAVGVLGTGVLTWLLVQHANRYGFLDEPTGDRHLHSKSMPTGGGVAIAAGVVAGATVLGILGLDPALVRMPLFWAGGALVLVAGMWDDFYGMDAKGKFTLQIIAAYLLLQTGVHFDIGSYWFSGAEGYKSALVSIPLSMIWIVGIINAVNLIDGLDGLASGVSSIAFFACAILFGVKGDVGLMMYGIVAAGTLGAFLVYNFNPASIFMGDTGSLFVGYLLSAYTLQQPLHQDPYVGIAIAAMLVGVPVLDTIVAIVRRFMRRKSIFAPDSRHLHHRLMKIGNERYATLTLYAVSSWFGSAAILMGLLPSMFGYVISVTTMVVGLIWAWRLGCLSTSEDAEIVASEPGARSVVTTGDGASLRDMNSQADVKRPSERIEVREHPVSN